MRRTARRSGILYGSLICFLGIWGLTVLAEPIQHAVPETDSGWMLPVFSYYLEGNTPLERLVRVLPRALHYMDPPGMKLVMWMVDDFLKLPFRGFLWAGVMIHLLNSLLLSGFCRLLGLSWRVAVSAGVIFGSCFVHFHSFLWLPTSQHPYGIATLLGLLCLFLLTERRVREGGPFAGLYGLTALAALAASLQHCWILALPLMISATWVLPGLTAGQRGQMHRRWLPVWAISLIYPVVTMTYSPEEYEAVAFSGVGGQIPSWLKAAGLFGAGLAALILSRWLLRFRRFSFWITAGIAGLAWMGFLLWDSRQVLLPYNALVPWMTMLGSFLDPLRTSLQMDATESYYYMGAQISVFHLGAVLFLLGTFLLGFVRRKRGLALLGVWCVIVTGYLLLHRHVASAMPFRNQSRYFLYLTPLFAAVLASVVAYGVARWGRSAGWSGGRRDALLAGILLALCVPNLLAIRIALLRGRLTNTYLVYDDARLASLIREDVVASGGGWVAPGDLHVENAVPTLFSRTPWVPPVDYARIGHANLRRLLGEAFGDRSMQAARINENAPVGPKTRLYRVEAQRLIDREGRSVGRFAQRLDRAVGALGAGDSTVALDLFRQAALERPFVLNYVLGRLRLADLLWITGGEDFRDFFRRIGSFYWVWGSSPTEKAQRTYGLIEAELSDYLFCLLCVSYLEQEAGRADESRHWLSQMWFIERDPGVLVAWLERIPQVRSSAPLRAHLKKTQDPFFFREPIVRKKEDYAVGRFLMRLLFHWDIRSKWDHRAGIVL